MRNLHFALIASLLLSFASSAWAASPFNASASLRDNLTTLMNAKKPVAVVLKNGEIYRATIGAVGDHFVVLTKPQTKEYFDVLVAIDEIAAVEARVDQ